MLKLLGKHISLVGIFLILMIHTASAQLLGLALSLGNTLAGYIFDIYLRTENTLDIDGAPNWYLRNDDAEWDCAFGYAPGSLASVEKAKTEATKNLVAQQEQYVQSAIRNEVQRRKPRDEKAMATVVKQESQKADDAGVPVHVGAVVTKCHGLEGQPVPFAAAHDKGSTLCARG